MIQPGGNRSAQQRRGTEECDVGAAAQISGVLGYQLHRQRRKKECSDQSPALCGCSTVIVVYREIGVMRDRLIHHVATLVRTHWDHLAPRNAAASRAVCVFLIHSNMIGRGT